MEDQEGERGVYIISVAAELVGVHPQTLRIYERKGLLQPSRTAGNTRRYSERDIARLHMIQRLTQEGVNLAGVKMIVEMENELGRLRHRMESMRAEVERAEARLREELDRAGASRTALVPVSEFARLQRRLVVSGGRTRGGEAPAEPERRGRQPIPMGPVRETRGPIAMGPGT
jgi:MerR family transcriptional regulator/heat shock protein HspR